MTTFKVGDVVRITDRIDGHELPIGSVHQIEDAEPYDDIYYIDGWYLGEAEFELVREHAQGSLTITGAYIANKPIIKPNVHVGQIRASADGLAVGYVTRGVKDEERFNVLIIKDDIAALDDLTGHIDFPNDATAEDVEYEYPILLDAELNIKGEI